MDAIQLPTVLGYLRVHPTEAFAGLLSGVLKLKAFAGGYGDGRGWHVHEIPTNCKAAPMRSAMPSEVMGASSYSKSQLPSVFMVFP